MVARRGRGFSAATSIAAGFGEVLHSCRAMQQQSSLFDLGEKGVYPSYTPTLHPTSRIRTVFGISVKNFWFRLVREKP